MNEIDAFYITIEGSIEILPAIISQRGWLIAFPFPIALLAVFRLRRPIDFLAILGILATFWLLIFMAIFSEALMASL